jgi:hypothetical protein
VTQHPARDRRQRLGCFYRPDAKIAAYWREVRQLEDKFDSLELNHIPRHLNEAVDALAKAASGQELVPTGVSPATSTNPQFAMRSQNRAVMVCPISDRGLNNRRLDLAPKSWSLKKIQRQSPTLGQLENALPRLPPP